MFLPPVSSAGYAPPPRASELRAVAATPTVQEVRRRETEPELNADQQRLLEQMRERDRELRRQERAEVLFGSSRVRALPHYTYERGPDGDFYAIEGVASLDLGGRGMLDQALARPAAESPAAAAPGAAEPIAAQELSFANTRREDAFAAAATRFYLTSAAAGQGHRLVDLFA